MRLMFAFIKWIFAKIGEGLYDLHRRFRRDLVNEPGVALFLWFIVSLLSSIATMLILVGVQYVTGISIPVQVWLAYIGACVFYLLYTAVSAMYNAFKAERAELFETIKNGR